MLSLVIPVYNEEKMLPITTKTVEKVLKEADIPFEILYVNDGSEDKSWAQIESLSKTYPFVRGLCFSRNFGKEAAITAGLAEARGDCSLVMDCDLQDPPEKIPEMYKLWQEGYEIVEGVKQSRGRENAGYGLMSRIFNKIMSHSTGVDMSRASDFKLLDAKVVAVLLRIREDHMFFRAVSSMIGFQKIQVPFDVQPRAEGTSKWSKKKLFIYAVTNITSYTIGPMKIIVILGMLMFLIAVLQGVEALYRYFTGQALGGFTTVILLQLIIGSAIMVSLGVIGYYISRIFDEVRDRPRYIISIRTKEDKND